MFGILRFAAFLLAMVAFAGPLHAAEGEDTVRILDASGSMWGQIDGTPKMEIARRVFGELLDKLPAERRLGLVAYGHREKGNCKDIEEIAAPGADRASLKAAVAKLNPKGKTPVSDSVVFAAERLKYTENRATIVLVSDGQETCDKDPCAVGRALEAAGVDLTVHIVGFGLESATESAGLKCLAEATGGRYLDANNAGELGKALTETVAAPAPEPPTAARVILRATELEGGPEIKSGLAWTIRKPGGEAVFTKGGVGAVMAEVPAGDYEVEVVRASDGAKKTGRVSARDGVERTVTLAFDLDLEASLKLTPDSAPAGSSISVAWTGPNREGDYVTVVPPNEPAGAYKDYFYTKNGNPADLRLSFDPGTYEVRYVLGQPTRVLARAAVTVTATTASLTAPDEAPAGSTITVSFTGPGYKDDWITVVKPDAAAASYKDYFYANQNPGEITLPVEPGDYEVRYVSGGTKVLARRPIKVTAVSATIKAPASAPMGSEVTVEVTGPGAKDDWVTVVPKGASAGAYKDYFYANREPPHVLEMPLQTGPHEIRYVQAGKKVLASVPIDLTPVTATLKGPARAKAGEKVSVTWEGPNYDGDYITVTAPSAAEGAYKDYAYTTRGNPVTIEMPAEAGSYELRYLARGKKVMARQPIEVTGP